MRPLHSIVLLLCCISLFIFIYEYSTSDKLKAIKRYVEGPARDQAVATQYGVPNNDISRLQSLPPPTPKQSALSHDENDHSVCRIEKIDPFSKSIMKYMHDFGLHKCPPMHGVLARTEKKLVSIAAVGIRALRMREISDDLANGFKYEEYHELKMMHDLPKTLVRNFTGTLKKLAVGNCILPGKYEGTSPPKEIDAVFVKDCSQPTADFTYTTDGLVKNLATGKCLGPAGGATTTLSRNHKLVLTDSCDSKFTIVHKGVLQLEGTSPPHCVHPYGGGDGDEDQQLCLWPSCDDVDRLTYAWSYKAAVSSREVTEVHQLNQDMSHMHVELINGKSVDSFVLTVVPRSHPTPKVPSVRPNVIVLCLERVSAQHFKRKLGKTNDVANKMEFLEYGKHSAVSSSSAVNFAALLTGAQSISSEASLFHVAKQSNYVAMLDVDEPSIIEGIKLGWPITHNSLPYHRAIKATPNAEVPKFCVTGQPAYNTSVNYLRQFISAYPAHPKLAVTLLSNICGPNFNFLGYIDGILAELFNELRLLKNTIIVLTTLRGGNDGKLQQLPQGLKEAKRPLLSVYVSPDIRSNTERKLEVSRASQLSTLYDVHVTLHNLMTSANELDHKFGKSLLKESPERTCPQSGIEENMCPCS